MHALKTLSMVITFAALTLSGSAAWAQNSFVATAGLNGLQVVPSIVTSLRATLTLPFRISPPTTTGQTIERRRPNPWTVTARQPSNEGTGPTLFNIRLYFGQNFANGQPIATLCDDNIDDNIPELPIPKLKCVCEIVEVNGVFQTTCEPREEEEFELRDIQFPKQQIIVEGNTVTIPGVGAIGRDGRLTSDASGLNEASGLKVLRRLINRGLIYVVINSAYRATLCPDTGNDPECPDDNDPETDDIIYTPPAPDPKGGIIVDGELRGTLRLVSP